MTKYRKKYILENPTQWFKDGDHPKVSSASSVYVSITEICPRCGHDIKLHGLISTLEDARDSTGRIEVAHMVCPGDWIVEGQQGEYYAIKPDIFEATYEKVEE